VKYVRGDACRLPFLDQAFDGAFSNGSMHEWEDPIGIFKEIHRPGGVVCVTDLKRNINPILKFLVSCSIKPRKIRPGFLSSVSAAYTADEIPQLLSKTKFAKCVVTQEAMGLSLTAWK
jgi:ubiquinone/menaquinone biosynthesis C-methylase UbiE